jgi:UDP-N-acetylmuramate--alanine ligase
MKIHFIGIGGIGISALARYYLEKGHKISGSDLCFSEITQGLKKIGARVIIGEHKAQNVPKDVGLVIYSPAVQKSNPEIIAAKNLKISNPKLKILSYPQALGELTKEYYTIAVSGTHGKSTTCAMLSLILIKAKLNPTVIVGTKLWEFNNSNFYLGGNKFLVIEADEHFASFLNYWPKMIVLTNIDADHLDYYKNLGNIIKTFKEYTGHLPKDGLLVWNRDDKNSSKLKNQSLKLKFKNKSFSSRQSEAKKIKKLLKIPGDHMVANALAALTAARALGIPDAASYKAISEYNGAWRRFEILQEKPFILISDYGHNPAKMLATLKGAREKYPKRKIWCVYQPHQYQRTYFLFKEFVRDFCAAPADNIILTDIYDVAGREEKKIKKEVSSEKLAATIKKSSIIYLPKEKIVKYLKRGVRQGDVVIIMGAGDIYKLCDKLI